MIQARKKKLTENGPIHEQHLQSGIQFLVKYSGSQLIEDIRPGQQFSATAVSAAIQTLLDFNRKARHRSTPAVLTLSIRGIELRSVAPQPDPAATDSHSVLVKSGIERIAYCTADKRNNRVFGFVARNQINETVELHVCKCANQKEPVQLAYSLNEAFKVAARNLAEQQRQQPHGLAAASIDEQPLVWCEAQARTLSASRADSSASELQSGWVQFSA
ncbi:hypothetical protein BOX15_Mlig013718g3 [Macrostomum lignano]|uniref:Uncharacterized protein n=3 Tax=Macrostomum lignano TaxID=282301 RepID=A0A267DTU7_9PLAT|nr:hypothetical protein BOX15_Mlig009195g2 [Macrostomum lignano]PAA52009.1 hypothetical protein BOX15_Mlig013718g3 [Macrostomum lignano]